MSTYFLIILSLYMIGNSLSYKNPYQTLKVGSFHSLPYIYKSYLDLINSVNNSNTTISMDKLYLIKKAYIEIKVSRRKEKEEGDDEPIIGLIKVGKQCTIALIIFYITLSVVYYALKFARFVLLKLYFVLIVNIVIFNILQTFFISFINDVSIQYFLTMILSISFLSFRYFSKNRGKMIENCNKGYGEFKDVESENN